MSYIGASPTNTAFVTDTFSGNGSTTAFTTSVAPASTSSILVSITGVLQDPSTYSVSGTTLTFSAAPPSGTGNISIRYLGIPASGVTTTAYRTVTEFTATAGQTSFSVPSYTVGYIDVYRNGARLGTADFTATNGTTVVLTNACNLNDLVVTESFYVSSVLNAIPATAGAVNSTYITDAAVTQAKLASGVAGNGPAVSAYLGTNQSISHNTSTKVQLNTELFDTANCFDTTNYRYVPNVAGYYAVDCKGNYLVADANRNYYLAIDLRKNNVGIANNNQSMDATAGGRQITCIISKLVYMNGTTDYLDLYAYAYDYTSAASVQLNGGDLETYFTAVLVRAA